VLTYVVDPSEAVEDVDAVLEVHMQDCGQPDGQPCLLQAPSPHMPLTNKQRIDPKSKSMLNAISHYPTASIQIHIK
jgi:hypothetical protein